MAPPMLHPSCAPGRRQSLTWSLALCTALGSILSATSYFTLQVVGRAQPMWRCVLTELPAWYTFAAAVPLHRSFAARDPVRWPPPLRALTRQAVLLYLSSAVFVLVTFFAATLF